MELKNAEPITIRGGKAYGLAVKAGNRYINVLFAATMTHEVYFRFWRKRGASNVFEIISSRFQLAEPINPQFPEVFSEFYAGLTGFDLIEFRRDVFIEFLTTYNGTYPLRYGEDDQLYVGDYPIMITPAGPRLKSANDQTMVWIDDCGVLNKSETRALF